MILKDLLEKEKFQYLRILNRNADITRVIQTVESTEIPDVSAYISKHTLLVMTGIAFREDPESMCRFLEELDQRACTGVAIKLGRFLDSLDHVVLETADRLGLPLLQIPMDVTLGTVYHEILSFIWNNQNDQFLNALNAQQKITTLILHGSSLKSIINNMSAILEKPVMIVDMFGNIRDYGYSYETAEREKTVRAVQQLIKESKLETELPYFFQEETERFCVYPIKGIGRNANYMIIQNFDPKESDGQILVMEQVKMALELYFFRDLYMKYNSMKSREEFLTILLHQIDEKSWTEKQILSIGEAYGLMKASEYQIVILELENGERDPFSGNLSQREESYILVYEWIRMFLEKEGKRILIFPHESMWRYVLLLQGKTESVEQIYRELYLYIKERFQKNIRIGLGGSLQNILKIKNSYKDAQNALEDGQGAEDCPYLFVYKPRNFEELFQFMPERETKEVCITILKDLAFPENLTQEELRKTLAEYLFCGKNIAQTAETLSLHRNTIKYRIKKCEELMDSALSEERESFQIQLALILSERIRKKESR